MSEILVRVVPSDLEEDHRVLFVLEVVSVQGGPLHHQADHPALVVERVVHPLLLAALRGLGVVGARGVKVEQQKRTDGPFGQLRGYWAMRTGHS